jgi:hypothetical protein
MKKITTKFLLSLLFIVSFIMSCDKTSFEGTIIVHSEYVKAIDPVSATERNYMQIKDIASENDY